MKRVNLPTIHSELEQGDLSLIDVREAEEFSAGHVPGAINLPLSELADRYKELNSEQPYHLICHSGGRSAQACLFLAAKGYDVTNIDGGTIAWTGALDTD